VFAVGLCADVLGDASRAIIHATIVRTFDDVNWLIWALVSALLQSQTPARGGGAACQVQPNSVVSRTPSGTPQVSNLALIEMEARVPRRPVLNNPDYGVRAEVTVYELAPDGTREVVRSSTQSSGGGGDLRTEYDYFTLTIPIDDGERDQAIREYLQELSRMAEASPNEIERAAAQRLLPLAQANPQMLVPIFRQHHVGRFEAECRVMDQGRLLGIGRTEFEVLFKGRFFDQMLRK
jgi:hypothetical protein